MLVNRCWLVFGIGREFYGVGVGMGIWNMEFSLAGQ